MKYKIFVFTFLTIFLITGLHIVSANVVSQSKGTSLVVVTSKKKVSKKSTKKKKKIIKKKNVKKKTTSGGIKFNNANYTGPFPAPEGMVLEGTYGKNKFKEPTGNGPYRFKIQTAWEKNIHCLDKTRTVVGSKGTTWEEGYWKGRDLGYAAKNSLVVIYDNTPKGTKAGDSLYDEGYKLGYDVGFSENIIQYIPGCLDGEGFNINNYDEDGWEKFVLDKLPSLKALYKPFTGMFLATNQNSAFGDDAVVFHTDEINDSINTGPYNSGKPKLNISSIDLVEGQLDSAEAALTTAEFAQAFYNNQKKILASKAALKSSCEIAEPQITEKTYGNNDFTDLGYITVCLDAGDENKWTLSRYSFMKLPGDKMLIINITNPLSVKAKGIDDTDTTKLSSKDFIEQLYSKIQVKK